jgi:hypothetical protein
MQRGRTGSTHAAHGELGPRHHGAHGHALHVAVRGSALRAHGALDGGRCVHELEVARVLHLQLPHRARRYVRSGLGSY